MKNITVLLAVIMSLTMSCGTEIKEEVKKEYEIVDVTPTEEYYMIAEEDKYLEDRVSFVIRCVELGNIRKDTKKETALLDSIIKIKVREDKINNALRTLDSIDLLECTKRGMAINEMILKVSDSIDHGKSKERARKTLAELN